MDDLTKAMLEDIERRNHNLSLAKSILGVDTIPISYAPNFTKWTKYKGNLVTKTDEGYKYI